MISAVLEFLRNMTILEMVFGAAYVFMAIWGFAVVSTGILQISNEYVVRDTKARLVALLLLFPFPVALLLKMAAKSALKMDKQTYAGSWFMYDMAVIAIFSLAFIGLGMYLAPPDDGNPQMATKGEKKNAAQKRGKK